MNQKAFKRGDYLGKTTKEWEKTGNFAGVEGRFTYTFIIHAFWRQKIDPSLGSNPCFFVNLEINLRFI
jgi:hypothetical protein